MIWILPSTPIKINTWYELFSTPIKINTWYELFSTPIKINTWYELFSTPIKINTWYDASLEQLSAQCINFYRQPDDDGTFTWSPTPHEGRRGAQSLLHSSQLLHCLNTKLSSFGGNELYLSYCWLVDVQPELCALVNITCGLKTSASE